MVHTDAPRSLDRDTHLSSTRALVPVRRKRLCTFSTTQAEKRRVKHVEKEAKVTQPNPALWLAEDGGEGTDLETLLGPPSPVPIIDSNGFPYKGTKSNTTTYLQRQYTQPSIILQELPQGWVSDVVLLEGMFFIELSPLLNVSCSYAGICQTSVQVRPTPPKSWSCRSSCCF